MYRQKFILMDNEPEAAGGGQSTPPPTPTPNPEMEALKKEIESLKAALAPKPNNDDLLAKARMDRENLERETNNTTQLESALKFDLQSQQWVKDNASLLPSDVADLFEAAKKENYSNAIEKTNAIKSGIVQSYFAVQSNLDLLTAPQKNKLAEYLKLTKTVRDQKAPEIFESIFEPTFEMAKKLRKAELLSKGLGDGSNDNYKKRLMEGAQKHYLTRG